MPADKEKFVGSFKAAEMLNISRERLRYWEWRGIIKPRYVRCGTRMFRKYSPGDIRKAKLVIKLVDEKKYTLEGAKIVLAKRNQD